MLDEIIIDFSNIQPQKYSKMSSYEQLRPLKNQSAYLWCDNCFTWVDDVTVDILPCDAAWVCCASCCNGLIRFDGSEFK